jgi:acetyl esterase/lipase
MRRATPAKAGVLLWCITAGLALAPGALAAKLFRDPQFSVQLTLGLVYGTGGVGEPAPGSVDLLLDLYEPTGFGVPALRPAFVIIHGGGFTEGSRLQAELVTLATELASRGYVCISIDYRLEGQAPTISQEFQPMLLELGGHSPDPSVVAIIAALEDAVKAHRWLVQNAGAYQVDPTRIAVGGGSAGAVTALNMAYTLDDHGIIDLPAIGAAVDLWGGIYPAPVTDMETGEPPLIIIHGEEDPVAPFALAEALVARATAVGVPFEFHPIAGAGHGFGSIDIFSLEASPGVTLFDRIVEFLFLWLDLPEPAKIPGLTGPGLLVLGLALPVAGALALSSHRRSRVGPGRRSAGPNS